MENKSLSEPWIDLRCSTKSTGRIFVGSRQTDEEQVTTRPGHIWSEEWSNISKSSQRKPMNKWAEEKPQIGRCESTTRHLLHSGRRF